MRINWRFAPIDLLLISLLLGFSLSVRVTTAKVQPTVASPHWVLQHWQAEGTTATLASSAADTPTHPASITKLLTAYVSLQAVAAGETTLTTALTISEQAATQDGTRVGYRVGERVAVQDALQGMLAISGNDAAWALAQHLGGGDVSVFIVRMNATSKTLGLHHSQWQNPHGLTQDGHASTAADLAALAHALWRDFPIARPWLGVKTYTWNGIAQNSRNSLLWRDATVDGLKTGHTDAAGYNLAASSNWRVSVGTDSYDWRLTSVVLGADSAAARAADSAVLLVWGRSAFVPWRLYPTGAALGRVALTGAVGTHAVTTPAPVWLVLPTGKAASSLRYELQPLASVVAPVTVGTVIAQLHIYDGQTLLQRSPAIVAQAVAAAPWYTRAWLRLTAWLKSWFR
jgi:D-alanyl-D-alanine carboxypeptidase (penicillin-binding protein 5/6)